MYISGKYMWQWRRLLMVMAHHHIYFASNTAVQGNHKELVQKKILCVTKHDVIFITGFVAQRCHTHITLRARCGSPDAHGSQ